MSFVNVLLNTVYRKSSQVFCNKNNFVVFLPSFHRERAERRNPGFQIEYMVVFAVLNILYLCFMDFLFYNLHTDIFIAFFSADYITDHFQSYNTYLVILHLKGNVALNFYVSKKENVGLLPATVANIHQHLPVRVSSATSRCQTI